MECTESSNIRMFPLVQKRHVGAGAGVWGTPMPRRVAVTVVMGAPLVVPHIADPTREQVQEQLRLFIAAMKALVEKHKAAAGYPDLPLRIY